MNTIEFYRSLEGMKPKEAIEKFLLFNSSLVMANTKPSVTVNIKKNQGENYKNWLEYGEGFLVKADLNYITLRENDNALILLIYKDELLKNHILKEKNREFLNKIGYANINSIEYYIKFLKIRYQIYKCPHELGVFLGIPVEDVIDFMDCNKKKCLGCGYWKIYNNYDEAIKTFKKYDEVKFETISNLIKGVSVDNIISSMSF
jgi:hypothetical protein